MKRTIGIATAAAAIAACVVVGVTRAPAAWPDNGCVSHAEFDQTTTGMTRLDVANLYGVYGSFIGDTPARYRIGYTTCWAPAQKQAVVAFSYDTDLSVDWWVRDL